jgi:glycosyltransferase involved in cell wall biosynthesis
MSQGIATELPTLFMMTHSFEVGGSERQFVALARSLRAANLHVRLGCNTRKGEFGEALREVSEFPTGGNFLSRQSRRSLLTLAGQLRRQRIAIAHSFDFYANLMLIPCARLAGVPVVIGSHRQLGDLLTPLQFGIQAATFGLCDRIVCNSRAAAARLADQGLSEDKIVVIPNMLPDSAFRQAPPALPRQSDVLRIGMIARMNHGYKNHRSLLRAAGRLVREFPTLEVLLAGDGPLRPELERTAASLGLGSRVQFLGNRQDIPAIFASMDISVLPSSSESLSNVIMESMAAALPVVATRVGGTPELVRDGETGLLVTQDNDDQLVAALRDLLNQPGLRTRLGRRARQIAQASFSLTKVRNQYEQLYAGLLAEKGWEANDRKRASVTLCAAAGRTRVAFIAPSLRYVGGQSVQADLLLRHWENDAEVDARIITIDPEWPRGLRWVGRVPFLRTVLREPLYLASLWRGLKDADIAHIFSASYWSFLLAPLPAWVVARARGTKVLINYRSGEARDHLTRWRTARWALQRVDRVVVPSQYLVKVFREFGLEPKAVPNLVDLNQFRYRRRDPLRPLLVCTRGFGAYYRVDLVVRAFDQIKKEFPEARLSLVGEGPLEREIRALVRELNLSDVEFAGRASRKEIGRFYHQADIFINASCLDNMPVSVLEAFACGTPVVTTAAGGIRFIVEHERTGLMCEPGDWKSLASNVIRLLRDPGLASCLAENAYRESQKYRWEAVRPQWIEIYSSLMAPEAKRAAENIVIRRLENGAAAQSQTWVTDAVGEAMCNRNR